MVTAFAKLKDELDLELTAKGQKRERLPVAVSLCQSMDKSREKLEKADPADWSEEDRRNAIASVIAFRDAAAAFISELGKGGSEAGAACPLRRNRRKPCPCAFLAASHFRKGQIFKPARIA